jgi:lysophospholipase L1-like esterase
VITFSAWHSNLDEGWYSLPTIEVTDAPVVRSNSKATQASSITDGSHWCIRMRESAEGFMLYPRQFWAWGTPGTANSAYAHSSNFGIFDSAGTQKYVTFAIPKNANAQDYAFCSDAGVLHVWLNGTDLGLTNSGAGSGVLSNPSGAFTIGTDASGGNAVGARVSVFEQCDKSARPSRCNHRPISPTLIGCLGDSLTWHSYPDRLAHTSGYGTGILGSAYKAINAGVAGDTVSQMLAREPALLGQLPSGSWFVFWGGTNDLSASATAADTYAIAVQILDAARLAGQRIIILGVAPRGSSSGWTSGKEAQRVAYNTMLLGYAQGTTYVSSEGLGDGASPAALKPIYDYSDGLHYLETGYQFVANLVATAMGFPP